MADSAEHRQHLFPFLITHILPEFNSPMGFLRARACWCIEHFAGLDWDQKEIQDVDSKKDKKGKKGKKGKSLMSAGQLLSAVLQSLLRGLRDPTLPVQCAAACSLRSLIELDEAKELLRPMLKDIVGEYFRIMEEVENESVLASLQTIVSEFGDAVADFAPTMAMHLVTNFSQYSEETEDEESAFNAIHCLDIIDALLEAVQDHPAVLSALEPILQPLFLSVLNSGGDAFEYIDTVVHMIAGFTCCADVISSNMWALCGPVVYTLNSWAIDYICEMMAPILNYMTKDMSAFLAVQYDDKPVLLILLEAIGKVFDNEEGYNGNDISAGATLLTCMLTSCKEQCPGKLHGLVPQILAMVYTRSLTVKLTSVKVRLLEVIMSATYYDAPFTLAILNQHPAALLGTLSPEADLSALPAKPLSEHFFPWMFNQLGDMKRDFTQRLIVLCFMELFAVPVGGLPAIIGNNLPAMFKQMIYEVGHIEKTAAKADDEEFEDVSDEEDDDDEDIDIDDDEDFDDSNPKQAASNRSKALYVPDGGYDEDEDCVNAEDEEYRKVLEDMTKEEKVKQALKDSNGFLDDDEDEDAYSYTSSIELMDVTQRFFDFMHAFSSKEAALFGSLRAGLSAEDANQLEELYKAAQEKKNAQQQQQS